MCRQLQKVYSNNKFYPILTFNTIVPLWCDLFLFRLWYNIIFFLPLFHVNQWVEESFTNFQKGINWRSYVVCDVAYNNVNNWLWTPFIDRGVANRIYIEIKFTIRDCSLFPGGCCEIVKMGEYITKENLRQMRLKKNQQLCLFFFY